MSGSAFRTGTKKARDAGTAPTIGLASLQMVAVLTPVHATCTEMQGQNTGFRQILHHLKNLLHRCNSREFIVGIKRFVLTLLNYFRYKYSIIFSILSYATRRKLKNGRRLCDIFRKALENREDIEHKSPRP